MTPEETAAIRQEAEGGKTCDNYHGEPWAESYCLTCGQYKLRHSLKRLLAALDQLTAERAAASAENARLRYALVKVRAHTSYVNPTPELLAGLLASIERIVDAALASAASPPPEQEI